MRFAYGECGAEGFPRCGGGEGDVGVMEHGLLPAESPGRWPVWLSESGSFAPSYFWLLHDLRGPSSPTRGGTQALGSKNVEA